MSHWTHIAGLFRFDDMASDKVEAYKKMRLIEDAYFEDAPHGSEGPMQYTIIPLHEYKSYGNVTSYGPHLCDVAVSGDFRDFESSDWDELRTWFNDIVSKKSNDIRQAVLLIEDEGYPAENTNREILAYGNKDET